MIGMTDHYGWISSLLKTPVNGFSAFKGKADPKPSIETKCRKNNIDGWSFG
jgi:propanediol dehydratase large subunit